MVLIVSVHNERSNRVAPATPVSYTNFTYLVCPFFKASCKTSVIGVGLNRLKLHYQKADIHEPYDV